MEKKPRGRGRPKLGKEHVSVDLYPKTVALARARAARDDIPFCEAIDRSIQEANSKFNESREQERLQQWLGLKSVPVRSMDDSESSVFEELYRLSATRAALPPEASMDRSVEIIRTRLGELQSARGIHVPVADDYVTVLCGMLSNQPGVAGLWAYTLFLLFRENGNQPITMDAWVKAFPEGVPTDEAIEQALNEQLIRVGQTERNFTEMVEKW